jgi:hypothetical protein
MRRAVGSWLIRLLILLLPATASAVDSRLRAAMNIELQILDPHISIRRRPLCAPICRG